MTAAGDPRAVAIRLLARREHGARELEQKLMQRGFAADDVAEALAGLRQEGLQSDARFAESFVSSRMNKGYGLVHIRAALRERQVDEALIEAQLENMAGRWQELAAQARRKRFGAALPEDYQERARQARFLQYRGFSHDQIRKVLKQSDLD